MSFVVAAPPIEMEKVNAKHQASVPCSWRPIVEKHVRHGAPKLSVDKVDTVVKKIISMGPTEENDLALVEPDHLRNLGLTEFEVLKLAKYFRDLEKVRSGQKRAGSRLPSPYSKKAKNSDLLIEEADYLAKVVMQFIRPCNHTFTVVEKKDGERRFLACVKDSDKGVPPHLKLSDIVDSIMLLNDERIKGHTRNTLQKRLKSLSIFEINEKYQPVSGRNGRKIGGQFIALKGFVWSDSVRTEQIVFVKSSHQEGSNGISYKHFEKIC